jgi:hypothetical protein
MISTVTRLSTDGTTKSISPLDPYFRKFGNAVLVSRLFGLAELRCRRLRRERSTAALASAFSSIDFSIYTSVQTEAQRRWRGHKNR